jgi:hypothetical protein
LKKVNQETQTEDLTAQSQRKLGESITGQQAEKFNAFLDKLWSSRDDQDKMIASELYLKTLEYFKPKQARQTIVGEGDAPVQIVISDKL